MKPYLKRLAELHFKRRNNLPLTDMEIKEWIESLDLISKKEVHTSVPEHVLGYLWMRYRQVGLLCKAEKLFWSWALDQVLNQYWSFCELKNLAAIADMTGDRQWFMELQEKIEQLKV